MSEVLQDRARGNGRHSDDGCLIVRYIYCVNFIEKEFALFFEGRNIGAFGRTAFRGDCKMPCGENFFETAFGLHGF